MADADVLRTADANYEDIADLIESLTRSGRFYAGLATGDDVDFTASVDSDVTEYYNGMWVRWISNQKNADAASFSLNGIGAEPMLCGSTPGNIPKATIWPNAVVDMVYYNSNWVIISVSVDKPTDYTPTISNAGTHSSSGWTKSRALWRYAGAGYIEIDIAYTSGNVATVGGVSDGPAFTLPQTCVNEQPTLAANWFDGTRWRGGVVEQSSGLFIAHSDVAMVTGSNQQFRVHGTYRAG